MQLVKPAGMTLRLPIDLREAVTEEARVAGDLSRVVLFALRNVERKDVTITQTRKAGLPLSKPQLLHVGAEVRSVIRAWAEEEGVSVNAIVVLFLSRLKNSSSASRGATFGDSGATGLSVELRNWPCKQDTFSDTSVLDRILTYKDLGATGVF
jgi:hypothetical protein